jgi:hypothetical protein
MKVTRVEPGWTEGHTNMQIPLVGSLETRTRRLVFTRRYRRLGLE